MNTKSTFVWCAFSKMNVREVKLKQELKPYDVTMVAEDGKEFRAHRQVLSEASPFFEKLLGSDMKENKEGVIRLEILSESQMTDILEYIYTGNIQISTHENAENLIAAADYLCLSNLKHIAGKFLEQNLSTSNCFSTLHLAEEYHCDELIDSTRKFIHSNFAIVAETEHFLNLSSHAVEKLISSDEIVIDGEEDVFKIIFRWIERKKSERSVKFSELFRHVRLTCVSRDFLMSDVVTNDLVKGNKDCLHGVNKALTWFNRATYVSRPHSPRKSLETCVIVVRAGNRSEKREVPDTFLYVPGEDEIYFLPKSAKVKARNLPEHVISHRGKVFFIPQNIHKAQCYDPVLNHWIPAPWTIKKGSKLIAPSEDQLLSTVYVLKTKSFLSRKK